MRYRVKDYTVEVVNNSVWLYFTAPKGVTLTSDPDNEIEPFIKEAIRLVVDESNKNVLCSSMQKDSCLNRAKCNIETREIRLMFNAPTGKVLGSSEYTIEMDWGDEPGAGGGGEIEMMTESEYAPALEDLGDMLDEIGEDSEEGE